MSGVPALPRDFWRAPAEDLLRATGSTASGLSSADAEAKLRLWGANAAVEQPRRRIFMKIVKRLTEPLIAILIAAALVSAWAGDWTSSAIIAVILTLSIALDVVQEHQAENAVDALKRSVAVQSRVRRDGEERRLPVRDLVPGDIVLLRAGDLVPADGVVLESRAAHANEALLTGEPFPVEKRPGPSDAATPADAFNALFGGTPLVSGEAIMLVVATGSQTRFGGIAAALASQEPPSAFERSMQALGALILRMTAFLVLLVLLANLALHRPVLESFLFAVALAVGLTPELLPMITTVTLSRGAVRMARRKVIVKRLASVHDLGAMDVLCTDKTGTLTEAQIVLVGHPGVDGADSEWTLELAAANSRFESGVRSPLDDAIVAHSAGLALNEWRRIADVPFDFERRRVSVLAQRGARRMLVVKGAPEDILARSTQADRGDGAPETLDAPRRAALEALLEEKSRQGLRCLGVAWREMPDGRDAPVAEDESALCFAGFCVFVDPPKASAAQAVALLGKAGVRVKIISGDAGAVVRHIVETLGLPAKGMLTGQQIAQLSHAALAARAGSNDLFVRVSPEQKTRVINALKGRGHIVGFLGDGINDAPAIRAADVGLSVDGASDIARAAADMILLEHDLRVLADGVAEGRRTFANIMKYVRMGTSSNFGNMLSMAFASMILPFLPLTPVQVLLNNLIYDLSETGIPFDDVDADEIAKPHSWRTGEVLRFALVMGPLSSAFDIATFILLSDYFHAAPEVFRTAWFVESTATQILVVFLIRTARPAWASRPNRILTASSLIALGVALAIALSGPGAIVGFAPLTWPIAAAVLCLVALYLVAAEFLKGPALRRLKTGARRRGAR